MAQVRKNTRNASSVRDLPTITLDLAGKEETFTCPKLIIWRRTQVMIYVSAADDLSTLEPEDLKNMETRLDEFFTAAMGTAGYRRFNKRFLDQHDELDEHHLIYALAYLTHTWKDHLGPMADAARVTIEKLVAPLRDDL